MSRPSFFRSRWLWLIVTGGLGLMGLLASSQQQRLVLAPLVVLVIVTVAFFGTLLHRSTVMPLDEIGTWYVPAVAVYGILPLLVFLVLGLQYTPLNDLRLFEQQPAPEQVGTIGWYHVCYLAAFGVAYLAARGSPPTEVLAPVRIKRSTATAAIAFWWLTVVAVFALGLVYDLNAETYGESYVVLYRLPLGVRQLLRLVLGMRVIFSLVILAWLFADYRRRRWIILLWVVVVAIRTVLGGGARTDLVLLLAGSAILYHQRVRPVSFFRAWSGGAVLFTLFMTLGIVRQIRSYEGPEGFTLGVNAGEFESMFANAVDLEQRKRLHEFDIVSPRLYLSELAAPVPSQLLPFQKIDLADWYLETFYPAMKERGHGYAFGAVAQGIVGFGWLELVVRGALVGYVFARLHRAFKSRSTQLWPLIGYLWLVILSYQSFRNITAYPFSMFVQQFIPALLLVELGRAVLDRAGVQRRRPVLAAGSG